MRSFLSMNSLICPLSLPLLPSLARDSQPRLAPQHLVNGRLCKDPPSCGLVSFRLSRFHHPSPVSATSAPNEGTVSVVNFEELLEKDWSFLEMDGVGSDATHCQNVDRILSAGKVEPTSKVLVSFGSEVLVDKLVESSKCQLLLVVHDSLFVLAGIKEKYDRVKCWQGELIYVPEKWAPLDAVFIYFLPALPFTLDQIFGALAKRCLPGARVVISHPEGRQVLDQQRRENPEAVISDLPDETALQKVAAEHSFTVTEFIDETRLYLAVLTFNKS
ncbi:uncharacterized protein LOC116209697 [Punica granatum]|uniref:Uncharacterized protein n=2 Tax=Punica granatum TaxID=22663 RepID=A0A2I0JD45_PUNGR|nr:uncharacterized protein LOC116209697 [Punica granatum]PKI54169.1 hypothetical protein CRG98_025402 [Punica granatum]